MADGLFNLVARRSVAVTKDGKTYQLSLRSLADYAKKEEAILAKVGNPYAGIESISDKATQQLAMKIAADTASRPLIATMVDEDRFDRSMRGLAYSIWRGLGKHHATEFPQDLPIEQGIQLGADFIDWFDNVSVLADALYRIEEKDIVKNSDCPAETTG